MLGCLQRLFALLLLFLKPRLRQSVGHIVHVLEGVWIVVLDVDLARAIMYLWKRREPIVLSCSLSNFFINLICTLLFDLDLLIKRIRHPLVTYLLSRILVPYRRPLCSTDSHRLGRSDALQSLAILEIRESNRCLSHIDLFLIFKLI
jgi:hypothetical protein